MGGELDGCSSRLYLGKIDGFVIVQKPSLIDEHELDGHVGDGDQK